MENPIFVDDENIPLVAHHDKDQDANHYDDYNDYKTPNVTDEETKFTTPSPTNKQPTSTLWLTQKVKRGKLAALYRHLNVIGDLELINLDRFNLTQKTTTGTIILEFFNGDKWVPLTKQTDKFLVPKTLRERLD